MNEKIFRTINDQYVSLTPGDEIEPFQCTGCAFYNKKTLCQIPYYNENQFIADEKGYLKSICDHHRGIWRNEKVEVDKKPRRKLNIK